MVTVGVEDSSIPTPTSPSSSLNGNPGALVPEDGSTDVTSVVDHPAPSAPTLRRRIGAASAALTLLTTAGLLLDQSGSAQAATAVGLGTADGFAVLAGTGITNTGPTTITGDIGIDSVDATFPGESDIVLDGSRRSGTVSNGATADLDLAIAAAAGQPSDETITADLGGRTLKAGVYTSKAPSAETMGITGALTLDAEGDPDAVFVFQVASALTTASDSSVVLTNGAQACNVYWQIGSSATLGTRTDFVGNILAHTSVTLTTEATVRGRVLASNGSVTMDDNTITRATCTTPDGDGDGDGDGGDGGGEGGGGSGTGGEGSDGGDGSGSGSGSPGTAQVPRVPVGSVDAGDGSSRVGSGPDSCQ